MTRLAALAAAACFGGGCATMMAGGPDEVPISTNPPGAYVYLDGRVVGRTPLVVTLDRKKTLGDIRIYYPGFQPVQITRYKSLNGWLFVNFLFWPGVAIDFLTGNWQRFNDDAISLRLTHGESPPPYGIQPQMTPRPTPQVPH